LTFVREQEPVLVFFGPIARPGNVLGELKTAARELEERVGLDYEFGMEDAVTWILTGTPRELPAWSILPMTVPRRSWGTPRPPRLKYCRVDFFYPPSYWEARRIFQTVRTELLEGERVVHPLRKKAAAVLAFIEAHGPVPASGNGKATYFKRLRSEWNRKHGRWRYRSWRGLAVVWDRAGRRRRRSGRSARAGRPPV
jgi:hypothetical protein